RFDAKASTYLPGLRSGVTVRQLAYHISGYPTDFYGLYAKTDGPARTLSRISAASPTSAPGSTYAYNNTGYFLLAQIVRAVSHQPFAGFVRQNILLPLGMTASYFDDSVPAQVRA